MRNGVAIPVAEGSAEDVPGRFDVVIANIVSPVLQSIAPHLAARLSVDGTLIVAGISAPNETATRQAFAQARLEVLDRTERDDWVALALAPLVHRFFVTPEALRVGPRHAHRAAGATDRDRAAAADR